MPRQKNKSSTAPHRLPDAAIQKKPRQKKESAMPKSALANVQKCKELGVESHLQANKTRANYAGHVRRGQEWLASHFDAPTCSMAESPDDPAFKAPLALLSLSPTLTIQENPDRDVYNDPVFKDAFSRIPNRCSDKALALFMSLKGFHENRGKATVEGIRAAFKKFWEQA
jgi:hypothetical protein